MKRGLQPKTLLKLNFSGVLLLRKKQFWLVLCFLGAIAACIFWRHVLFDHQNLTTSLELLPNQLLVPCFLSLYIVLTVLGIPGTILTTVGGLLFGLSWGTFWSVWGATLGALGAFWTARYLLQSWLHQKFQHHPTLKRLHHSIEKNPLSLVLTLRFAPISPFNVLNFLFGLTPIHWFPYTLGTFIGIIPGTIIYTWLGISGKIALSGGDRLPLILSISALLILSLLPFLITTWCAKLQRYPNHLK
ncbi:MAG: TVP38/TMEM64 family protein [Limnothrix sp.]